MVNDNGYAESIRIARGVTFGLVLAAGCWGIIAGIVLLITKFI